MTDETVVPVETPVEATVAEAPAPLALVEPAPEEVSLVADLEAVGDAVEKLAEDVISEL